MELFHYSIKPQFKVLIYNLLQQKIRDIYRFARQGSITTMLYELQVCYLAFQVSINSD